MYVHNTSRVGPRHVPRSPPLKHTTVRQWLDTVPDFNLTFCTHHERRKNILEPVLFG